MKWYKCKFVILWWINFCEDLKVIKYKLYRIILNKNDVVYGKVKYI